MCFFLKKWLIFLYSERVKMEVTAVEEKCDRRIELLTQSIKKTRKRARIERIEEDDEEWVPSVFLHAEQTKVQVSLVGTYLCLRLPFKQADHHTGYV